MTQEQYQDQLLKQEQTNQLNNRPFKVGLEGLVKYINWDLIRSDYNLSHNATPVYNDLFLIEEVFNKLINSNKQ
jgi:hypothetical protein